MIEYITLAVILLAFEYAYFIVAKRLRIVDRPHHQSSHTGVIVRGGGIIFYMAFLIWSLSHGLWGLGNLLGLTLLAVISFIDDIYSISPQIRLICQFLAIMMIFYHTGLVSTPFHVIIILTVACVGAVNIFNFITIECIDENSRACFGCARPCLGFVHV